MANTPQSDQIRPIEFPLTDPTSGRQYRTYTNKRGRTVKVYKPRPEGYVPPLTNRDKKQEDSKSIVGLDGFTIGIVGEEFLNLG